ncbi:uncharacterized protein LOC142987125 [Anticarsia gemmatalis]|uniref:uncharacterized protein LOC142987125 n=1 Tax=Anticarsia gemmatalis TaxID=129554 RepID=UPI003F7761D9
MYRVSASVASVVSRVHECSVSSGAHNTSGEHTLVRDVMFVVGAAQAERGHRHMRAALLPLLPLLPLLVVWCAVCTVSTVECALALAPPACNTAQFGRLAGRERHVVEQRVAPRLALWNITVPPVCERPVGVRATACDGDVAPLLRMTSLAQGRVQRVGALATGAYLYMTVHCEPSSYLFLVPNTRFPTIRSQLSPPPAIMQTLTTMSDRSGRQLSPQPTASLESSSLPHLQKQFQAMETYEAASLPVSGPWSDSVPSPKFEDFPKSVPDILSNKPPLRGPEQGTLDTTTSTPQSEDEPNPSELGPQYQSELPLGTAIEDQSAGNPEPQAKVDGVTGVYRPPVDSAYQWEGETSWSWRPLSVAGRLARWWARHVRPWTEPWRGVRRAHTAPTLTARSTHCTRSVHPTRTLD